MFHRPLRAAALIFAAGAMTAVSLFGEVPLSRRDAEAMKQKMDLISAQAARAATQPRRTTISEAELNSFLAYDLKDTLPAGVLDPSVSILGTGRVSGRAIVDLDAVRKGVKTTSLFDPRNLLAGRLPVTAVGVLHAREGVGRFELESATISGVPIPKLLLQEIVAAYSRSPDDPDGIGLDEPFALPARIREIQVQTGRAVVVQ